MRETYMHVAGVVATDPTLRRFDDGRQVVSFRVASTSRRYDNNAKDWVDGPTLWVKVSCWRELAANAAQCVRKRDRVVVWGRVRSEQWKDPQGAFRSDLALEAEGLGHDLAFGVSTFERKQRAVSTQTLTDGSVVDLGTGELSEPELPPVPAGFDEEGPAEVAVVEASAQAFVAARPAVGELYDEDDDLDDEVGDEEGAAGEGVPLLASA